MSIDLAIAELRRRRAEQAEAERDGSWEAFAAMKRTWGFRRKREFGWPRAKMKAWLEIAAETVDRGRA